MSRLEALRRSLFDTGIINEGTRDVERIIAETEYALYMPKHEGIVGTYGAIFAGDLSPPHAGLLDVQQDLLAEARQLSDGLTGFLLHRVDAPTSIVLQHYAIEEELDLIEFASAWDAFLVHKKRGGDVRIFAPDGIALQSNFEWIYRPHARSRLHKIREAVPQLGLDDIRGLLNLAFHILSPSNVGATLVWWLADSEKLAGGVDISSMGINVNNKNHYGALKALLRQHDGATYISSNGEVVSIEHHLGASNQALKFVVKTGGTRHTSAARFSFDEPRVVIAVVSADGPVSIFSDGMIISTLSQSSCFGTAESLRRAVPGKASDITDTLENVMCGQCGKTSLVEVVTIHGFKERESGECPVCGHKIYSAMCHSIKTQLIKNLPGKKP